MRLHDSKILPRRIFLRQTGLSLASLSLFAKTGLAKDPEGALGDNHAEIVKAIKALSLPKGTHLTLLHPQGCEANLKPIINAFSANTGIKILLKSADVDIINSTIGLNVITDRDAFDIAIPATFGIPDLVEAGALKDLTLFERKYAAESIHSDMLFSTGDYYKEKFFGYQTDGDAYVMFYNRLYIENPEESKRFEDTHGYALKIPETWDELDAMMAHFHRPKEGLYGGCLYRSIDYTVWEWWIRFHANGSYPLSDNLNPLINNESGIKALEAMIKSSDFQHPSAFTNGLFENWKLYADRKCFANIGWGGTQKFLRSNHSKTEKPFVFGELPGGTLNGVKFTAPFFNWGWNYVVSNFSQNPELAFLFTLYASLPALSASSVSQREGYFDPFRKEHYENPDIIDTYGTDFLKIHKSSMTRAIPDFYMHGYRDYFAALKESINLALKGTLSPQLSLDIAAKKWDDITDEIGRDSQMKQWSFLKSLYPEHIKHALS